MKLDKKLRDEIVKDIKSHLEYYNVLEKNALQELQYVETYEEFMRIKQYLFELIKNRFPIGARYCPFCSEFACQKCPYAKHHGLCNKSSDYMYLCYLIEIELEKAIRKYYKNETYKEE